MRKHAFLLVSLAALAVGCDNQAPTAPHVRLDWQAGEQFYVGASYRVASVKTEEIPVSLDGSSDPAFGPQWTDEVYWTYQVVDSGLVPTADDQLYPYAVQPDGSVLSLAVVRAYVDPALNDDPDILEADPVVYLVFREDRDRLAAVVSFTNVDGQRVQRAWSSHDLDKSWSALSQSQLTSAPTYLAPFAAGYGDDSKMLEDGTFLDTVSAGDGSVDVYYDDELGGGLVMNRYESGQPWPTVTESDNLEAHLLTDADLRARRAALPPLLPSQPEDFDYRAALASTVDIDAALVLDQDTMAGGWTAKVPRQYQPWAGSWWPQRKVGQVFGWRSYDPTTNDTISDNAYDELHPLKKALDQLGDELRDMPNGAEKDQKLADYKTQQSEYIDKLVAFYNGVLQGLQGGTITIADGTITKAGDGGWSYDLNDLSPYDKWGVQLYLDGQTYPNPFFASAWTLLNGWAADENGNNGWWGYCNGWSGAAILENEPREPVTVTAGAQQMRYDVADLKGLTTSMHYSTTSRFYGSRYYKEGDDINDLTPKAFHRLITFYVKEQGIPLVFDTVADVEVWNYPAYGAQVDVTETTPADAADRVDINTAKATELQALHGIGEVLSQRIVD